MEIERFAVWTCEVEEADTAEPKNGEYTEISSQVFLLQGKILK